MTKKYAYLFREGKASMKDGWGGKEKNLCEMTNIGLPVPPGFTITTEACNEYYAQGETSQQGLGIKFGRPWPRLRLLRVNSLGIK